MSSIRVKTTFLAATDTEGERIRVRTHKPERDRNFREWEFGYDYSARNAHTAAIRAVFGDAVTIAYDGAHARGYWYLVT